METTVAPAASNGKRSVSATATQPVLLSAIRSSDHPRIPTGFGEIDRVLGGGIVPGSIVLLGGEPGIGKCVTGDTRVFDPTTGDYLPITAWQDSVRSVLAMNAEQHRLAAQSEVTFLDQGVQPIVEVKTRLGHVLRCTPSHPVFTIDGWQAVGQLPLGTRIAMPHALPYFGTETMPDQVVKLIAYILSDGSAQSSVSVTAAIPEVARDLEELARYFGMTLSVGTLAADQRELADMTTPIAHILTEVGLRHTTARNKAIPACIFRLPREQIILFLKVLFSCDGSVYVSQNRLAGVSYSTISHRLAQDVQHLLLRFGFITKLRTKPMTVQNEPYFAYELQMLGVADVQRFLQDIGIWGRQAAQSAIMQMPIPALPSTHFDTVPTGDQFWNHIHKVTEGTSFKAISRQAGVIVHPCRTERPLCRSTVTAIATAYPSPYLQTLASSDIYWDEIESIIPMGEEQVYDLNVPDRANFVANDLIIHNSTLLAQAAALVGTPEQPTLYVSAEESPQQIKMRADRLGIAGDTMTLLAETDVETILETARAVRPRLMIIDSIQTIATSNISSVPGSISQVRECTVQLMRLAKAENIAILLIGHVTKDGTVAGPRALEHIVDAVLYLEGERFHSYRILRSVKNRFGATEVGIFEMRGEGMVEVADPSGIFLTDRTHRATGAAVTISLEGTRPLLVEVQALASATSFGTPSRTVTGVDHTRLLMLLAVLAKRCGLRLGQHDVYVNVVSGIELNEPAVDLGIAAAIASSFKERQIGGDLALIGEVGLGGELRSVTRIEQRLREAARLGFHRCILPKTDAPKVTTLADLQLIGVGSLAEAIDAALVESVHH